MKHIIISLLFFAPLFVGAQNFQIANQQGYGGNDWDGGRCVIETADGGFIICSKSLSNSSIDKSVPTFGGSDIWVIKVGANGSILWQKGYGGVNDEVPYSIIKTSDGNFVIVGTSNSNPSGNKTSPNYGGRDSWLLKIDNTGLILWQQTIGGSGNDNLFQISELNNSSLVLIGSTNSPISGNKTEPKKGIWDYWLVFLNPNGGITKQYDFGGSQGNFSSGLSTLNDSILLISGVSDSPISIDKTEPQFGEGDFWVLKCDTSGNIIKDITIGGNLNEPERGNTLDENGNLIVYGFSNSSNTGNKTSTNFGDDDIWIVKFDSELNIIWDKSYGGLFSEQMYYLRALYSSNLHMSIIPTYSKSSTTGNKTSPNYGDFDYWILGIDDNGDKVMEISIGGFKEDKAYSVIETSNNTLKIIGHSYSDSTGVKTVYQKGVADIWIVELDVNLSIEKIEPDVKISAYPVPTKTVLNFSVPLVKPNMEVSLINVSGQVVYSASLSNQPSGVIDVTGFASGTYILKMNGDNFSYSRTVVIE